MTTATTMTTATIAPRMATAPTASRPRSAAVYRRRRLVAATLAALTVVGLGSVATGALGGSTAAIASDASPGPAPFVVIAQPGDTMWALAHRYRGEVDHGRFLEAMVALNGSASLRVGQTVLVP